MAILTGIENGLSKSVGEWTFAHVKGQTVAKQKIRKPATPTRTYLSQKHRGEMANVDNFWTCTDNLLKYTMEKEKDSQTEQNVFVSHNLGDSPVYLTKEERMHRTCILYPYVVSYGTLEHSISVHQADGKMVSDLSLGNLEITPSTTKGQLLVALLDNNKYLDDNKWDVRVVFYRAKQIPAQGSVAPTVDFSYKALNLNAEGASKTLAELGFTDGFSSVAVTENGVTTNYLACDAVENSMVTWCWTKEVYGVKPTKRMCSTQRLVGSNSMLEKYTSKKAMFETILSLGGVNKENVASPEYEEYKQFIKQMRREVLLGESGDTGSTGGTTGGGPGTVHEVTVSCNVVGGHGTVSPAFHTVTFGSNISFTAAPEEGYRPDWPDGSHELTYSLQARETTTIQLSFSPKSSGSNPGGSNPGEDFGS